jgi:phage baseplate assembly protein gpV
VKPGKSRAKQQPSSAGQTSLHFGKVSKIDTEQYKVRVRLDELGGMESFWLRCGPILPDVGTLVAVFLQNEGSGGFVMMAGTGQAERFKIQCSDGTYISYEDGTLEVSGQPSQITLEGDRIDLNP